MKITAVKTHKITVKDKDIFRILDKYIVSFKEKSVLAVASKIVSICEGRVVRVGEVDRDELIKKEADLYIPKKLSKYDMFLTLKNYTIIPASGIDESNGAGYYILWPKNPQGTANKIREYLCNRFNINNAGVIIVDSKTTPLRWGTTGVVLAHSGFLALNDYIGKTDIFGRKFKMEKANISEGMAAAAVLIMGEGAEQTPLAVIDELPFVTFQPRNPTKMEIDDIYIQLEDDIYAPVLKSTKWKKGGS